MATPAKERRKRRSTQGRVHGVRFDWDAHGAEGYAVAVQERSHEDSGDLIAAKIRRDWDESTQTDEGETADPDADSDDAPNKP